jgi:tetratricopeptide (TPR) repeat protein
MAVAALMMAAVAHAQPGLTPAAQEALEEARAATDAAVQADTAPFPDRPAWQRAADLATRARALAPEHPAPVALLAEVHSRSNFHAPAWQAWQDALAAGYELDADTTPLFTGVAEELAWSAYDRGDLDVAANIHRAVLEAVPFHRQSRVWLGRILLEQGRPADAVPYWQAAAAQDASDDRAAYYLRLAQDQAAHGTEAASRFRDGVRAYEAGDLNAAADAFARATEANGSYAEAWAWRGRVAFEQARYGDAEAHYGRASELNPGEATYSYFENQARVRKQAGN